MSFLSFLNSNLHNLGFISIFTRILISMLCGGIIGLERGKANQPAGMRTYMLVSLGAATVMITGEYVFTRFGSGDPTRLGAQVISGIGFLGAGSIMISGKSRIRGLTTAAGLWVSACIGLVIGVGFYLCGIIATVAVYITMGILKEVEDKFTGKNRQVEIKIKSENINEIMEIYKEIEELSKENPSIKVTREDNKNIEAVITVYKVGDNIRESLFSYLNSNIEVVSIRYI